jgi:hypothetical protein
MPIELLHGLPLGPEELQIIRRQIEEGFDNIAEVDPEIRGVVARNWPHSLARLSGGGVRAWSQAMPKRPPHGPTASHLTVQAFP